MRRGGNVKERTEGKARIGMEKKMEGKEGLESCLGWGKDSEIVWTSAVERCWEKRGGCWGWRY